MNTIVVGLLGVALRTSANPDDRSLGNLLIASAATTELLTKKGD